MSGGTTEEYVKDFLSSLVNNAMWVDVDGEITFDVSEDTCGMVMSLASDFVFGNPEDRFEEMEPMEDNKSVSTSPFDDDEEDEDTHESDFY